MPLSTPRFWQRRGILAYMLWPFSLIYLAGHRLKSFFAKPYESVLPVVCIGGVVAGGSGKTPIVHAVVKLLRDRELAVNPVILTRGYGGTLKGPTLVDLEHHGMYDVGDEALLHASHAPTIISADRTLGAKLAEAMGADIIIMDDGLQNGTLKKTAVLLVLDERQGTGNGFLIPAGPLREPLRDALKKATAIINGGALSSPEKLSIKTSLRITSEHDKALEYYGFAGLGYPEKFKLTLEENGFSLSGFKAFPDHHPYCKQDMEELRHVSSHTKLITTEKDFVRIPSSASQSVDVLKIEQVFVNADAVAGLMTNIMGKA